VPHLSRQGWIGAGKLHESVYDLAGSGYRKPGKINPSFVVHFKRSPRSDLPPVSP
jgi:hypothetical protein